MSKSSYILMGLLCLVPVAAFAAIFLFDFPASPVVLFALALACPIAHLLFLGVMRHDEQTASQAGNADVARR
jgi:Ca2+/H+ antiporter